MFEGRRFAAFLFDMDGTVLDSTGVADRVWGAWAQRQGLDVAAVLPTMYGVRSVETIRRQGLPGIDPELEPEAIFKAELEDIAAIIPIDGAETFLASLPPNPSAILT